MSTGLHCTVPPVVWEVVCLSSETASPEADVPSEDTREVSLSLPPSPSALAWQWLRAPELDTSSEILSSVDMFMGPCSVGQSDSWKPREGGDTRGSETSEKKTHSQFELLLNCHNNRKDPDVYYTAVTA